jgi:hypothetical protein
MHMQAHVPQGAPQKQESPDFSGLSAASAGLRWSKGSCLVRNAIIAGGAAKGKLPGGLGRPA